MFRKYFCRLPTLYLKSNYCSVRLNLKDKEHFDVPVMCDLAIDLLLPGSNKTIIDMTFGCGGHSRRILEKFPNVKIYSLDCDPISYEYAKEIAKKYHNQLIPLFGKFSDLPRLLHSIGGNQFSCDGILFDLGCSTFQLDDPERGFSVTKEGPLDMRMNNFDPNTLTAAEILSKIDESDLVKVIKIYGQEKQAKKIARCIVDSRSMFKKTTTTKELGDLVNQCLRGELASNELNTAEKTFQALRILVNNELNEINFGISLAHKLLKLNGRLVTITYNSLEDTIIKRHVQGYVSEDGKANLLPLKYSSHEFVNESNMLDKVSRKKWLQLNKHVITPTAKELEINRKFKKAKLRALQKIF